MGPAARTIVCGPDLDDPQSPDRRRDQVQEGTVPDLRVDDYTIFLKDANFVRSLDRSVALGLDPSEILRHETGRLKVHARSVGIQLVPHRAGRIDSPDETGQEVLGGVIPHVRVPPVPVDDSVDGPNRWKAVQVMADYALLLRHAKDLRLSTRP